MADEEETREVLFPDWEGADKTGMTIEQTSGGQLFVKEVKGESPAARSGKVYEGDQIVGATIYFENMSSEETADLLKTLNKHKVGLKLQNKGDKSPYYSPLSTPCRSPVSTLTWEGKTRFGDSSPDIILSGDDEDYKRIYTRKIKPRLKSEDLAEGVDVRTERHSSTSSDGSTITTITRRITTYTVDMPSGISEQLELSSPGLRDESGDGSSHIRISHGSPSGKMGAEEGVFESGDITYTGPNITSTVTRWGNGGVQTTMHIGEEKERSDLRFKVPSFGVTGSKCHEGTETSRGSREQGDESVQDSEISVTLRDNKNTASSHVTAGSGGAGIISTDENGGSGSLSLPGKGMKILTATTEKTQMGSSDSNLDERTKVKISGITISPLQTKGSGSTDIPHIRIGGSTDTDANLKDGRIEKSTITLDNVTSGLSSKKSELDIKGAGVQIKGPRANTEGSVLSVRHSESESDIGSAEINSNIQIKLPTTDSKYKMDVNVPSISGLNKVEGKGDLTGERNTAGLKFDIKGSNTDTERKAGTNAHVQIPEADIKAIKPSIDSKDVKIKGPSVDIKRTQVNVTVPAAEFGVPKAERLDVDLKLSKSKTDTKIPKVENKAGITGEIKTHKIDVKGLEINLPRTGIDVKAPDFDITGPQVDTEDLDVNLKGSKIELPSLSGTKLKDLDMSVKAPKMKGNVDVPKLERDIKAPKMKIEGKEIDSEGQTSGLIMSNIKIPSLCIKGPKPEGQDVNINLSKTEINVKAPEVDVSSSRGPKLEEFSNTVKGPKLKGDVTVSAPKMEGDLQAPKVDIEGRYVNIEGHKGGVKMSKVEMSSFGVKGPKVEGPDVDVSVPKGDIEIKAPNIDIKGADINVEGPSGKIKGPQFKMSGISGPKISMPDVDFNLKGPKVEAKFKLPSLSGPSLPDFDINLKGPKLKGDVDVSAPKIEGDIKIPEVDVHGPKMDIGSPQGKFSGPKVKFPTISGPKMSLPDVDINLKGPKLKGDMKGDFQLSKPEIEGPDASIDIPETGSKKMKFKMPRFGFKGPKLNAPDSEVKLPQGDINLKGKTGSLEGVDLDLELSTPKAKGSKFKMPKFGFKSPKVEIPDADINVSTPKTEIETPEVKIETPDIDVEGPSGKIKGPKFKMPNISGPKMSMPDIDFKLKGPKFEGDVNIPKAEGKIKVPEVDIKGSEIDLEGPKGGLDMPKIKMPTFGFKGPKVEGPDVDINLPKADVNVKGPEVDIKGVDIDAEGPSGKIKGPKFKMPSLSGPKISMPDVDFNLKGPKVEGEVDIPKIEGKMKAPGVEIEGPKFDIEGPKGGFEMPKIKMPTFGFKGPKDIKGPEIDIQGPKSALNMPSIKMPSFGLKGPKVEDPDADIHLPKADINVKTANISNDDEKTAVTFPKFKGPKFAMKTPVLEESKSNIKMPSTAPKSLKTEVSFPDTDASVDAADIDINVKGKKGKFKLPKVKGKAKKPDVDIETPATEINADITNSYAKGTKTKKSRFGKLHFPDVELDIKSPKLKGEGSLSAIDGSGSHSANVNLEGSNMKVKSSNIKMQSGTDSEINASASGGSASGGLQYPEGKVTFTKITMPKFGIVLPQVETKESGGNIESEPAASVDIKTESPSISCQVSSQNIEVPSPELRQEGKVKVKMPKLFGKSKAKGSSVGDLHGSEAELSSSGKAGKTSKELSVHSGEMMGGKIELEGDPGLGLSTKGKSASLDLFKKSRHRSSSFSDEGGVSSPSAQLEAEGGDISLDLGSKVKGKKGKLKFGTFGGFGSKSKGSYEVTLGDDSEARMEGSAGVSLPAKKSRLSSSSSSDSGSRGGLRFPKVELSVSPTK
ncbi:neuroblast differentiation-associated protein AHNAK [Neolamprologus brichardi]|uniref:neuroblast differentiation-associated protein AHNAK n=1 Tax=Neolamprologus brichardi TaxID=32507 RepID=UPI0016439B1A|nr:neuroblast differentiation-associated protein AHNAK [Neolamprologus brichardi]